MNILFIVSTDIWIIALSFLQISIHDVEHNCSTKRRVFDCILCGVFTLALVLSVYSFAVIPNMKARIICSVIAFGILIFFIGIMALIVKGISKRADKYAEKEK